MLKMKSKSFEVKSTHADSKTLNKSFDFVGFYKTAAEMNVKLLEKPKTAENLDKEYSFGSSSRVGGKKRESSPNKKKKKERNKSADTSHVNSEGDSILEGTGRTSPTQVAQATSTPLGGRKPPASSLRVKSIMKNSTTNADDTMDGSTGDSPPAKSKKRNKSVSFMLEETDEVASKKTKSDNSINEKKHKKNKEKFVTDKKKLKHFKKHNQAEKENKVNVSMESEQTEVQEKTHKSKDKAKSNLSDAAGESSDAQPVALEKKKKLKKLKKRKKVDDTSPMENDSNNNEEAAEPKLQRPKKKKRVKTQPVEISEGEPAIKVKKEVKEVAENLENLSIGDNAYTLTNLLDEMTVVDKDKKKKNKIKRKKDKPKSGTNNKPGSISSSETADLEKIEEGKEKVKWKKRKWNKDKKGEVDEDVLVTSVVVENLPLHIMCNYKKILADHFGKLGLIKRIGVAEMYPMEGPKPVFTTTIVFYSEGAAIKALEEDNQVLEGNRMRIKRPLPASQTTLVVRSYADLTEQGLSSVFTTAGRIRSIRILVKGRKSLATAFIEFDGPESVERALKMAEDARIGGKKMHVSKFELRGARRKVQKKTNGESENEGDSEDSND